MRLNTNHIEYADFALAVRELPGVKVTATEHGSRSHARAFDVRLEGNGTRAGYATKNHVGATWDEWGAFIAALYVIDPKALWGTPKSPVYLDSRDFHSATGWRFEPTPGILPEDTHKRHRWLYLSPRVFQCAKCSAVNDQTGY